HPHARGAVGASFRSALADRRLWLIGGGWLLTGMVFMKVTAHSVPFARDLGMPLERAAFLLNAYGVGAGAGRIVAGVVADRLGTAVTMYACVALQVIAL